MEHQAFSRMTRIFSGLLCLLLLILACSFPQGISDEARIGTALAETQTSQAQNQDIAPPPVQPSLTPPALSSEATSTEILCNPKVTADMDVNVRKGPSTVYNEVGALLTGQSAGVAGWNDAHTWWYIEYPASSDGHGWVWGEAVTETCVPQDLVVIVAPPTPVIAQNPTETNVISIGTLIIIGTVVLPNPTGDLAMTDLFLSSGDEIIFRVSNVPTGSISGSFTYQLYVDGSMVVQRVENAPTGSQVFWTGYTLSGQHTVRVAIDTAHQYWETNEANNEMTRTCNSASSHCG